MLIRFAARAPFEIAEAISGKNQVSVCIDKSGKNNAPTSIDNFRFTDNERFLEMNQDGDSRLIKVLEDVIRGKVDLAARLKGREEGAFRQRLPGFAPVVHCDGESSRRYTIVEIVAENALGLLYRMSRAMSESGCEVDLVLISTEGRRAIDVFHLTQKGKKLSAAAQEQLTENLLRVLEGRP